MTQAAITGDFATYRHVQGRKVLQLVIEVPAEAAAQVFATLGMPGSGEGVPVALARLVAPVDAPLRIGTQKERRPFDSLPLSQQCAMTCRETGFYVFLQEKGMPEPNPVQYVQLECGVQSRKEIDTNEDAARRWRGLAAEYYAWQRGMR